MQDAVDASGASVPLYWNGLMLRVPSSWNPAVLDKLYLLVEDALGPVMEVKWGWIRGPLSFEKVIHKLSRELKEAELFSKVGDDAGRAVPERWAEAVARLEGQGVTAKPIFWKARDHPIPDLPAGNITAGRGAIVHSTASGLALMIQFYEAGNRSIKEEAVSVLLSLGDPDPGMWLQWEVFDIRFHTPPWLELASHSFKAGRYRLEFKGRGWKSPTRLILERVGPAKAVLRGASLQEWAGGYFARELRSMAIFLGKSPVVEVRWARLPGRLSGRGSRALVRLSEDGRMILAVFLLNARPAELNEFGRIGSEYGTVSRQQEESVCG
jgi:hypothetical protein